MVFGRPHGVGGLQVQVMEKTGHRAFTVVRFSFLTGGILTALPVSTKEGLLTFCFITTATYWILILGMRLLEYLKGKSSAICEVVIRAGGKSVKVKGLYDTGNRLRDTLTRKPVSVVEYGKFEELLGEDQRLLLRGFLTETEAQRISVPGLYWPFIPITFHTAAWGRIMD